MENQSLQQTITITEKAAARLKNIMQNEEPSKKGIRVAIDTGAAQECHTILLLMERKKNLIKYMKVMAYKYFVM